MFRSKRGDTLVGTIEREHDVDLNARSDMTLDSLLGERGFDFITQLLNAYHGRAKGFAMKRRLFLSFDADDKAQVSGFRLMARNPNVEIDFYETSLKVPINSEDGSYLKQALRQKIRRASVLVCLIGNATAWSDWVDWEIRTAKELGKGLCGVRLKESHGRTPRALLDESAAVAGWDMAQIVAAIECAAARRS
ncbi:MAG: TIR domain-containing protein [Candidatus Acidiferrales bacterium]